MPRNLAGCQRCGLPLAVSAPTCGACQRAPPPFAGVCAPFRYAFPLDALLSAFKYRHDLTVLPVLESLLSAALPTPPWPADAVVPLPLHRGRRWQRGFNQAELVAAALARQWHLPLLAGALTKTRATAQQVGLSRRERLRNVAGVFAARHDVARRSIVLIDDVLTTGATVRAAAQALMAAGARAVYVVVVASAASQPGG